MVSPAAQGLFHRLILESGTCYLTNTPLKASGTPEQEDSAEERGGRFAREVSCMEHRLRPRAHGPPHEGSLSSRT